MVVTPAKSSLISQNGVLIINGGHDKVLLTGSMKTETSFGECGSERQEVLEPLTLAECCGDALCILLLANRKEFIVYLYHAPTDMLQKAMNCCTKTKKE